jgi:hypothetical protein
MSISADHNETLSYRAVFALGALGAVLPVLAGLLTVDLAGIIDNRDALTFGHYVGYCIRLVVLILLGGIVASLNQGVRQPLAIVQLGIAAPALITSYINGSSIALPKDSQKEAFAIVSVANAAEPARQQRFVVAAGFFGDVISGFTTAPSAIGADTPKKNLKVPYRVRKISDPSSCIEVLSSDENEVKKNFPETTFKVERGSC